MPCASCTADRRREIKLKPSRDKGGSGRAAGPCILFIACLMPHSTQSPSLIIYRRYALRAYFSQAVPGALVPPALPTFPHRRRAPQPRAASCPRRRRLLSQEGPAK